MLVPLAPMPIRSLGVGLRTYRPFVGRWVNPDADAPLHRNSRTVWADVTNLRSPAKPLFKDEILGLTLTLFRMDASGVGPI
jgi:hypothetical protein